MRGGLPAQQQQRAASGETPRRLTGASRCCCLCWGGVEAGGSGEVAGRWGPARMCAKRAERLSERQEERPGISGLLGRRRRSGRQPHQSFLRCGQTDSQSDGHRGLEGM